MLVSDYASSVVNNSQQQRQLGTKGAADTDILSQAVRCSRQTMRKAAMPLLAAIALSSATALLHSAPSRRTTRLEAKKRDYSAGGLGSSKQEQFARLWRDKDAPVEPPVARGVPIDAMRGRRENHSNAGQGRDDLGGGDRRV